MEILQEIGLSGLPGMIVAMISTIIGIIYAVNSSRSKAEEISKNAYEKAIQAMKTYTDILEKRIRDIEEENERMSRELKVLKGELKST